MKLYATPLSPYAMRNILQCRLKALPVTIEAPPGGLAFSSDPAYLAINPLGKIPALVTDDGVLPESAVIAEYLEARFPASPLLPADPWQRARVSLLVRLTDTYVMDVMVPVFAQLDPATRDEDVVADLLTRVEAGLDHLERFIGDGGSAAADQLSLADCALVPVLKYCEVFYPLFGKADPVATRPRLAAYWEAVQEQPVMADGLRAMQQQLDAVLGGGH